VRNRKEPFLENVTENNLNSAKLTQQHREKPDQIVEGRRVRNDVSLLSDTAGGVPEQRRVSQILGESKIWKKSTSARGGINCGIGVAGKTTKNVKQSRREVGGR